MNANSPYKEILVNINRTLAVAFLIGFSTFAFATKDKAKVETITFSPKPWCDVTMPASVKLGDEIEVKVDYKDLGETFLGCVMTYKSTARGKSFFACKTKPAKVKGSGSKTFKAKIPLRYGMTELRATVFIAPDASWDGRTDDTNPKNRKAKGKEALYVPVIYDKVLTRPEDDWHKKVETKTLSPADWCEIIIPATGKIGGRMNATVKYKDLEETNLTCLLYYVLKNGQEGYMSTAVQGTETVSGTGQKTFWLPILETIKDLKSVKVCVFLSDEGNWRTKTKKVLTEAVDCIPAEIKKPIDTPQKGKQ